MCGAGRLLGPDSSACIVSQEPVVASRFNEIVTKFGPRAQVDLGVKPFQSAGLFGNGDIESAGFNTMQEITPLVKGSRGGYGWFQWTGPRRRQYEAYCAGQGINPADDESNYSFMLNELHGSEKAALAALKRTTTVEAAATSVCNKYLRPGIPHLDKRIASARRAMVLLGGASPVAAPAAIAAGQWAEDGLAAFEIEAIQKRLRALGYFMVGKVDGIWGDATKAALLALQSQAGITEDGHWGPETKAALADDANKRVVSEARANTTASDLRQQGSVIAIQGNRVTWASVFGLVVALAGAAHAAYNAPADLPFGSSILLGLIPPPFGSVVSAVLPYLIAFLPLAYSALAAQGIVRARVVAEQTGLHNGEPDPAPSPPVRQAPDGPRLGGLLGALFGAR
jgi:peptidoglycan hydrolase-like protein with peptidoglycan-binding domain